MRPSLALLALAALAPASAGAAVLSETFAFTITELEGRAISEGPALGNTVGATFSFDTEAREPLLGGFRTGSLAVEGFGASGFGSTTFADNLGGDGFCCFDRVSFQGDNLSTDSTVSLLLIDQEGEVLSGPGVPEAFDFALIDTAILSVGLFEGTGRFTATYTRPETPGGNPDMPAVPLPASLPLLAAGLGLLGWRTRRP